jgi:ComF family protein
MQIVKDISSSLRHLFFPHVCKSCFAEIAQADQYICASCMSELPYTGFSHIEANPVEKIFFGRVRVEAATSLLFFTPASIVQQLIHQIKYKGQQKLANYMGKMMGFEVLGSGRFQNLDLVVPLPLFRSREKLRGYNQAALLGMGISEVTGIPLDAKAINRVKASATQTRKTRAERWQNMEGIFRVNPELGENRNILLVDDVITTGATLDACASALLEVKGTRVSIITLGYAMK